MKKDTAKNTYSRTKKAPKKISERYLKNAGKYYLERHVASSEQFRRILQKRVYKSVRYHHNNSKEPNGRTYDEELEFALGLVEKEVQRCIDNGDLHDLEFARNKVQIFHKQGCSKSQIRYKLRQKGISSEIIDKVVLELYTPNHMISTEISDQENTQEKYVREIIRLQMEQEIHNMCAQNEPSEYQLQQPTEHQIHRNDPARRVLIKFTSGASHEL